MIEVRWYYRPNEIPDGVYMPLMQDRLSENSEHSIKFYFFGHFYTNSLINQILSMIKINIKINENHSFKFRSYF